MCKLISYYILHCYIVLFQLEKTCERYLNSQRPLLTNDSFAKTEKLVKSFLSKDGQDLQKRLQAQDKANKNTSYISGPWFDMYLKDRRPVAFTHNPGISFIDDPRPDFHRYVHKRILAFSNCPLKWWCSIHLNVRPI